MHILPVHILRFHMALVNLFWVCFFFFLLNLAADKGAKVGDYNTAAFCFPLFCFPLEEKTRLGKSIEAKWSKGYSSSLGFAFNHIVLPAVQHQLLRTASAWGCALRCQCKLLVWRVFTLLCSMPYIHLSSINARGSECNHAAQ